MMDRIEARRQKLFEITGRWFSHDTLKWADGMYKTQQELKDEIDVPGMRLSDSRTDYFPQACVIFKEP